MKEIPLTQGKVALVDDSDFERLSRHKWHAHKSSSTTSWYARRNIRIRPRVQTTILMHREILGLEYSSHDGDHRDGNGLNNQRSNLRPASRSQNLQNQQGHLKKKYSRFKGVHRDVARSRSCWLAQIRVNGKQKVIGSFRNEEVAALAYNEAARIHFREFAKTNVLERIVQ